MSERDRYDPGVPCWVTTGLVASSLVSGCVAHVLHMQAIVEGFVRLGYPLHFFTLGEQDVRAEGGYVLLACVPDPLRARLQRRRQ